MKIRGKQMKGSISEEHREILCNMRTCLMKSMPYTDEDLNRPLVAVIHAWSDVSPGEYHLKTIVDKACPGPGACVEMATAHTMASISEALGMSLPGNAGVAAISTDLIKIARQAGRQVMALHATGITPKDIITEKSIENAIRTVLAVGGSANGLIHLPAITRQVDIDLTWDRWEALSRSTPFICSILPNNPEFNMKDFDRAGRTIAVMKELAPLLHLDAMTVTGKSLGENIKETTVHDRRIIRPLDDPFTKDGGIVVMKGNLAPDGGILKKSACPTNLFKHRGPARVFDADKYAIEALLNGKIDPGDFIIARYEGPRGCPGARKITVLMHTIVSVGLTDSVVLLTDGGFSGTNFGAGIGYISPEAGIGGPLAVVKEGDEIEMDVENRSFDLLIADSELKRRLDAWVAPEPRATKGTLGLYARYASSHATGAYIL